MAKKRAVKMTVLVDVDEGTTDAEAMAMVERAVKQQFGVSKNPMAFPYAHASFKDVLAFHCKFEIPMATEPSWLDPAAWEFRKKFLQEELDETIKCYEEGDLIGVADGLADLNWVSYGTALMMGIPWQLVWAEVNRANMEKVRANGADDARSKRGSSIDIVKPAGWREPAHTIALGKGPWPTFDTGAVNVDLAEAELRVVANDPGLALRSSED